MRIGGRELEDAAHITGGASYGQYTFHTESQVGEMRNTNLQGGSDER